MGLLNFLQSGWGMQQPQGFMPGEWDWMNQTQWGQFPGQMQFPGMPQQQQRPTQFPQARAPAAMPQPDENGISGPMPSMVSQVGTATPPPVRPPGFGERFQGFMDPDNQRGLFGPGMQMAMSLLGNGSNGGDWSRVGQDMRGIQQNQAQMANQRFQQFVAGRQMQRENKADARGDEQYKRWEQAVQAETDPARKNTLLAIGPDGYGRYVLDDKQLEAERQARLQQQEFTARENALDRNSRFAVAGMGRDPLDTAVGRMAAARVGNMQEASLLAQQSALPRIARLRAALSELATLNGVHNPVSAEGQILIGRLTGGGGRANQLREEIKNLTTSMSLDMAEKLKPMSNSDIQMIQAIQANPDMTLAGAMAILDNQEAELKRGVQTASEAARWFDANRGLGPNAEGISFEDYVASRYPAPKPSQQPAVTPSKAPQRGDIQDGYQFMGGDPKNPRNWKKVDTSKQRAYGGQPGGYQGR